MRDHPWRRVQTTGKVGKHVKISVWICDRCGAKLFKDIPKNFDVRKYGAVYTSGLNKRRRWRSKKEISSNCDEELALVILKG